MASNQARWGGESACLRPPHTTSASLRKGWRISGGQLASSQARASARKAATGSAGAFIR